MSGLVTDIHQHLWPEALLDELSRRETPPLIRRRGSEMVLRLIGEPDCAVTEPDHDPGRRRQVAAAAGIERSVIAISSPLGIEWIPGEEGQALLAAYNEGALHLGDGFESWGAISMLDPDPGHADRLLDGGHIGISFPAASFSTEAGLDQLGPVLELLERRSAPAFVHPGPVYAGDGLRNGDDPEWWAALTGYVDQMNRAWHAFQAIGRRRHPRLKVVFAMLAGGALLHGERLVARGGPDASEDSLSFYEISSYGKRAVDAAIRAVGIDQLLLGTDLPVLAAGQENGLGPAAFNAVAISNPARLLDRVESLAVAA